MYWTIVLLFSPLVCAVYNIPVYNYNPHAVYNVPYHHREEVILTPGYLTPHLPVEKKVYYQGNHHADDTGSYHDGEELYKGYSDIAKGKKIINDKEELSNRGIHDSLHDQFLIKDNIDKHSLEHGKFSKNHKEDNHAYHGGSNKFITNGKEDFDDNGSFGHRKGHKSTGFHKSYQSIESGKDTTFIDEDHDVGKKSYGREYDDIYGKHKWNGYSGKHDDGNYGHSAIENAARKDAIKSSELHRLNYDKHGHNAYEKNKDLLHHDAHIQDANRKRLLDGHSDVFNGHSGSEFLTEHI